MVVLLAQLLLGVGIVVLVTQDFPGLRGVFGSFGIDVEGSEPARARVSRFDERRAFHDLRAQVALGPRPAGSPASRRLAPRLARELPGGRLEPFGPPPRLANVVGELPGRGPPILVGAHYDTKDLPGFTGANDAASGTAVVLEVARALERLRAERGAGGAPPRAVRFVLFDGEESPRGTADEDFARDGLRGSRAYAARNARELGAAIVVDMVGDTALSLPREEGSDRELWAALRAAADRVGVGATFVDREPGEIYDDHTPFARAGVPAIDVIDFDYPPFHTSDDTLERVSPRSLDAVGEALVELLRARGAA